jgi:FKBP-type peptidyl-prolyl cis-trans isomerase
VLDRHARRGRAGASGDVNYGLEMPGSKKIVRFARPVGLLTLGASLLLVGTAAGMAGASSKKQSSVPTVSNATDLTKEPVVHADKAKAPAKVETKNLVVGTGTTVTASSTVTVKYVGAIYKSGKTFTVQTWTDNESTTFSLHGVIAGFADGLVGMKVGGRREIVIPSKLGYGSTASATIPATSTLVFVVDLVGVKS